MAASLLLHTAPRPFAEISCSSVHGGGVHTMLQAPCLGGARSIGPRGRRGNGVFKRKPMLLGFRAQSGRFYLPGTKKVKKEEEEPSSTSTSDLPTGTRKLQKLPGTFKLEKGKKDNNLVFVAGATGKVGSRVVRELLKLGFRVRAGVRDVGRGQNLLEMADEIKAPDEEPQSWTAKLFRFKMPFQEDRIELVECDLAREDEIEEALGNAGVVVCTIGASEKEVLDVTGPYRIDFKASSNLIEAATNANVNHFILVTSLGTTKFGWPASVLNLFWGVLIWKAKAEKALVESGLSYTIVRPGGMEKPTDAYKETHNLVLAPKDSLTGGQVSSLQVAELIASCVSNLDLARNKVLEAVAETTAPLRPATDLLTEISSEDEEDAVTATSKVKEVELRSQRKKASREQEEKLAKFSAAEEKKKKDLQARYDREILAAREKEEDAKREAEEASSQKQQLEKRMAEVQAQARAAAKVARRANALETALTAAAREGRRLSDKEKAAIVESVDREFEAESKPKADNKMEQDEAKTKSASSKDKRMNKLKAEKAEKVKRSEEKAAGTAAEKERLAKEKEEEAQAQKAKAEEESRAQAAQAAAESAEKAEQERLAQEELIKAEEEAKARALAEAKEQAEKDRIAKEEASRELEAKNLQVKAEAEAEAEAEKKADMEEKQKKGTEMTDDGSGGQTTSPQNEAVQEGEPLPPVEPKAANTFRWPWQKETEVETTEPLQSTTTESVLQPSVTTKGDVQAKSDSLLPTPPRPLSPYTKYPDVKPPSSPTPRPPQFVDVKAESIGLAEKPSVITEEAPKIIKEVTTSVAEVAENTEIERRERAKKAKEEAVERAATALKKAQSAAFRWPRQKPREVKEEGFPESTLKETQESSANVEIASSVSIDVAKLSSDSKDLLPPSRPLSPYTRYPGLKPPSSPTPSPPQVLSTTSKVVEAPEVPSLIEEKVSEITKEVASSVKEAVEDTEDALKEKAKKAKEEAAARAALALEKARAGTIAFRWPWKQDENGTEDTAPPQQQEPLPLTEVESTLPAETPPTATDTKTLPKASRPLSPYTRYPGLKPPTSPTPSPPKVTNVVKEEAINSESQEDGSGAGAQQEQMTPERELEIATAGEFKWPWQA